MIRLWNTSLSPIPIFVGILLLINLIQNHALYAQAVTDADSSFVMTQIDSARGLYKQQQIEQSLLLLHKVEHQARQAGFERGLAEVEFMRARCWNKLGQKDRALDHYSNAAIAFKRLKLNQRLVAASINMAIIHTRQGQLIESLMLYEDALKLSDHNQDSDFRIKINLNLAITLRRLGRHEEAIKRYFWALKLIPQVSDSVERINTKGKIYFNIASVYSDQKLHNKALEYLIEADKIFTGSNNKLIQANINNSAGINYQYLNKLDTAEYLFKKALGMYSHFDNYEGVAVVKSNLSKLKIAKGLYQEGIDLSKEALKTHIKLKNHIYIPESYLLIGRANFALGRIHKARNFFLVALNKSIYFDSKLKQYESYKALIDLNKEIGDLESVILYYDLKENLGQELFNSKITYSIAESEIGSNLIERDLQISSLQSINGSLTDRLGRKSLILMITILSAGIIVLSLIVVWQRQRIINRDEKLTLKHQVLLNH